MATTAAHGPGLILVGHREPLICVEWHEPDDPRDTGFIVFMSDVDPERDPDELDDDDLTLACCGCVISRWPHLQTALTIAHTHGGAQVDETGAWQPA